MQIAARIKHFCILLEVNEVFVSVQELCPAIDSLTIQAFQIEIRLFPSFVLSFNFGKALHGLLVPVFPAVSLLLGNVVPMNVH